MRETSLAGETAATGVRERPAAAGPSADGRAPARRGPGPYAVTIGVLTTVLGAFLLARLTAWPANEDETLVFFVSRQPLGELLGTVVGERGGAPLHFLLAHVVLLASPTLGALRLLSAIPTILALPVVAALVSRLAGRRAAVVAALIVAASWTTHFHAIYARMYGLFLLFTALSFVLLLRTLERPTARRWALWGLAVFLAIAVQPYGALVLAIQGAYVLWARRRDLTSLRGPALAFGLVVLAAGPLWFVYARLASRFDVGAGPGGSALGSPGEVFEYLWETLGDFTAGWLWVTLPVALATLAGLVVLARRRLDAAVLATLVALLPTAAFLLTRSGDGLFLETRHLVFALPFVAAMLAVAVVTAWSLGPAGQALAAIALAGLLAGQIAWGLERTPWLYEGEPGVREAARAEAGAWLAERGAAGDVLFGYEPTYLDAWDAGAPYGERFVPRADPELALETLREAAPLGHGVWVLDASDHLRPSLVELSIPERSPGPVFETAAFGPFLVVRSLEPAETPEEFLELTAQVQRLGRSLAIGDAPLNLQTAEEALRRAGS